MGNSLTLKWGTLKAWNFAGDEKAKELFKEYNEIGSSCSTMMQKDTPRQKEIICSLIDLVDGAVENDWTGEHMTKEDAKKYVMEYDTK